MPSQLLQSKEAVLTGIITILILLITARSVSFVAPANLLNVYNDTAILIILALGQMCVMLTRCIDLSVASNLALTGMIVAMVNVAMPALPIPLLVFLAIMIGTLLGMMNGILVWQFKIPPIVVTLGTLTIFRGTIFLLSDGEWINSHEMSETFKGFSRGVILGISVHSLSSVLIIVFMLLLIQKTPLGRSFFAVGCNPKAAAYIGIHVGQTQCYAFMLSGALAGLSGYLWVSRYAVAYIEIANGFELDVIAACVIGGISIAGGSGSVIGTVLGALFLGIIKNALPIIHVSPFWQMAISGFVIICAIAFNPRRKQ